MKNFGCDFFWPWVGGVTWGEGWRKSRSLAGGFAMYFRSGGSNIAGMIAKAINFGTASWVRYVSTRPTRSSLSLSLWNGPKKYYKRS